MLRRSRLTMSAPITPNIANAMTYGICCASDSPFVFTKTIPTVAIARNPTTTAHGHLAGRA